MAGLIRAFDWAATPLGPIDRWPQSLRTATALLVASPVPMVMLWGPEGVMIYNDAYSVFAGGRHPRLLGANVREGWPEVADFNDNVMRVGLAGGTLAYRDQELTLHRRGHPEQVWMDLDYWPVLSEDGTPAGVFCTVIETTASVLAGREARVERERQQSSLQQMPGFAAVMEGPRHVFTYANDAYVALTGGRSLLGLSVKEAFPELEGQGFIELLDRVYASGERFTAKAAPIVLANAANAYLDFLYEPQRDASGAVTGIFAGGYDVTEMVAATAALSESEERYRTLFRSITSGFCILQMKFDADGVPVDYMIVEGNPAFETMTGLIDANGKWVSEIAPGLERHWFDLYGQVALTGESARFENPADVFGRWYDVEALRIGAPEQHRVAVLFNDIMARKQVEARQSALIALGDALKDLTDPIEIAYASARVLAETLQVSRAGYGVVDTVAETINIERDFNAPGIASLAGVLSFRDYGSYIEDIKKGRLVSIADVDLDPRTRDTADALKEIGAHAFINMPLLEQGRLVALVFLTHVTPRVWTDADRALIREVADRVRDAAERARATAALAESEAQFRVFAQTVPIQIWAARPDGWVYWYNDQIYAYTGKTEADLQGTSAWADQLHPADRAAAASAWTRALDTGDVYQSEFRLRDHTGAHRWFVARAEPVLDAGGAIKGWVGSNTDIDDIRRLNAQLETLLEGSKAERDRLWTLSADALARADYAGGLMAVNPAWTAILGWSEHELLTNPYADIISPDDLEPTIAALTRMGETGQAVRYENRILSRSGAWTPMGWTVSPEPDGIHFIAVGRDLSEDKARERQLASAQEALRQSQKMEAVGQLTGGIAHDFNNLLAGISGSLELLSRRLSEGRLNGMERYIDAAQGSAQRAASLTQRLLAFSRRQTLDPRPTDVNRLIGGMEDLIRRTVGPDVEVEVVGADGLWATRIDPSQLENALLNLCINGRDAMAPGGGRLTIETANKSLAPHAAAERELAPGQYVSLSVTDTGSGMTPEVQAQAFDPFFTTKPLGQGTGLGLSMIHGFVRQSGGQVRIHSELGEGTTLCLYLPRYRGDVEADEDVAAPAVAEGGHGETVLIIDDEDTVRMLVAEVLGEAGYNVIEAPDGPSGLDILRSDRRIDLLISDVGLPGGMNGRQVADAARVTRPDLKVLFITGYAENAAVGNGLLAPGMEVLTKPFVMGDLAARVHDMIES